MDFSEILFLLQSYYCKNKMSTHLYYRLMEVHCKYLKALCSAFLSMVKKDLVLLFKKLIILI